MDFYWTCRPWLFVKLLVLADAQYSLRAFTNSVCVILVLIIWTQSYHTIQSEEFPFVVSNTFYAHIHSSFGVSLENSWQSENFESQDPTIWHDEYLYSRQYPLISFSISYWVLWYMYSYVPSWLGLDDLSLVWPTGVQLLDFCCSSVSVLVLLLNTHLASYQYWILILYVCCFDALMSWKYFTRTE